jgi:hypothetical protein
MHRKVEESLHVRTERPLETGKHVSVGGHSSSVNMRHHTRKECFISFVVMQLADPVSSQVARDRGANGPQIRPARERDAQAVLVPMDHQFSWDVVLDHDCSPVVFYECDLIVP